MNKKSTVLMAAALLSCEAMFAQSEKVEVCNSYENSAELLQKFPIRNPSPVNTKLERDIQNRMLNGFENWNRGYQAWEDWGNILYTPDSIYNVHGAHLTLAEYQNSMKAMFKTTTVLMGDFQNMIICDDWTAIRYDTVIVNNKTGERTPSGVIEFVNFKDYGDELGTRVVKGWGGTRDASMEGLSYFMTADEKAAQDKMYAEIAAYKIPDTKNLEKKYIVKHPTKATGKMKNQIKKYILEDFDNRNKTETDREYLYFDSMLIKEDWAGIHYRYVKIDPVTGKRTAYDGMELLHFTKDGKSVKLIEKFGN